MVKMLTCAEKLLESPKRERLALAALLSFAAAYRCWGVVRALAAGVPAIGGISYDGVYYVQIARNILAGDGLGWEASIFPVLQSVLIAVLSMLTGIKNLSFLSSLVSQIAGVLLLVPVYYLARQVFGKKAAFASVLFLIPYPHIAAISGADTAESLYAALIYLSLMLGYKALSGGRLLFYFVAGAALGLTYLARPEGLFVFAMFTALVVWRGLKEWGRDRALRAGSLAVAGFLLFALPYIAFLTKSYGRLVISPKLPYESVVMRWKLFSQPIDYYELDGLSENGELKWREEGGAGRVYKFIKDDPARFAGLYLNNLVSEMPWKVRNSSHLEGYPIVYPIYFWILAAVGFILLVKTGRWWAAFLLWAPFFNMFIYPVFTSGFWIYHAPYVPTLVILASGALLFVSGQLARRTGRAVPLLLAAVVAWGCYSVYVTNTSNPGKSEGIAFKTKISNEAMNVGKWGRISIGTKSTYMMCWSRLVYYLGGKWIYMPCDDPARVVQYGMKNGADYIVEELVGDSVVEGSKFKSQPSLELVNVYSAEQAPYMVVFWKINGCRKADAGGLQGKAY